MIITVSKSLGHVLTALTITAASLLSDNLPLESQCHGHELHFRVDLRTKYKIWRRKNQVKVTHLERSQVASEHT